MSTLLPGSTQPSRKAFASVEKIPFILVFSPRQPIRLDWFHRALPPAIILLCVTVVFRNYAVMVVHLLVFFVAAMAMHGRLAQDRPAPTQLTDFYLAMSIGGALGGIFNALVAPTVFPLLFELPLTVACALLLMPSLRGERMGRFEMAAIGIVVLLGAWVASPLVFSGTPSLLSITVIGTLVLVIAYLGNWRVVFLVFAALILVSDQTEGPAPGKLIASHRSFFGVHRVMRTLDGDIAYVHGTTVHGIQLHRNGVDPCEPQAYFTWRSRAATKGINHK